MNQNQFLTTSLDAHFQLTGEEPERRLEHFRTTVKTVPAYRAFLAEHQVDPDTIVTPEALVQLPALTKENYLLRHPLPNLCRNGRLEECDMIAVSSGSTGTPSFWPRTLTDECNIAWRFEQIFHDSFHADTRRTLAVICFTLGTWVGGMYTAACCRHLAAKGYPITLITPGNNREEIFRVVQALSPLFDQTVLLGYPPFLKDIIDAGVARGIPWPDYRIKLVMAGEVFSEEWRTLVGERAGMTNPCFDSASLYGTADAGVLGNETPLSISIRRFLAAHPEAARALFGESRLPTLVQYDPRSRYFEMQDRHLLFSGDNGIPLVRYNILDTGGIVSYEAMLTSLATYGFDPLAALHNEKTESKTQEEQNANEPVRGVRLMPFVYVFGRSNFTVSYFGANIYPENVTVGLEQEQIKEWVTGKFVLQVLEDADRNRSLSVMVETIPGIKEQWTEEKQEAMQATVADSIRTHLLRLNSEFAHYVPTAYQQPQVRLLPHGDPKDFPVGVKHRYTRK